MFGSTIMQAVAGILLILAALTAGVYSWLKL